MMFSNSREIYWLLATGHGIYWFGRCSVEEIGNIDWWLKTGSISWRILWRTITKKLYILSTSSGDEPESHAPNLFAQVPLMRFWVNHFTNDYQYFNSIHFVPLQLRKKNHNNNIEIKYLLAYAYEYTWRHPFILITLSFL